MVAEESRGRKGDLGETGLAGEEATVEKKMRRETGYKEESPVLDAGGGGGGGRVEEMRSGCRCREPTRTMCRLLLVWPLVSSVFPCKPLPRTGDSVTYLILLFSVTLCTGQSYM